jgi:MEDS: MEthanogen/methylotroph, DcmR Sensory domain
VNAERKPVRLAGAELRRHCHACAFFNSQDEEYRLLVPFAKEGYDRGEHVFHIADPGQREARLQRLTEAGIDCDAAGHTGQVKVPVWQDVYLRGGRFDQHAMLALVENVFKQAKADGFGATRLWANMEWSLLQQPGSDQLVEYESRLNELISRYDDVVVCTYDLNQFSAAVVMDVLRTHPMVIMGGLLHENPFFVPPEAFLSELRQRRAATSPG